MCVDTARATLNGTEIAGGHDADPGNGRFGGFAFRFDASRLEANALQAGRGKHLRFVWRFSLHF
jgi:hypothetical protein